MVKNLLTPDDPMELKGKDMAVSISKESPENQVKILKSIKDHLLKIMDIRKDEIEKI